MIPNSVFYSAARPRTSVSENRTIVMKGLKKPALYKRKENNPPHFEIILENLPHFEKMVHNWSHLKNGRESSTLYVV